jgi:hypothetical protein
MLCYRVREEKPKPIREEVYTSKHLFQKTTWSVKSSNDYGM